MTVCWKLLSDYLERVRKDGRTPADFIRAVILDQSLMLSEEEALIHAQLGNRTQALDGIEEAFRCLKELKLSPEDYLDVESRLLVNRAAIRRILWVRSGDIRPGDVLLSRYDIARAVRMKREIGEGIGLLPALSTMTYIFLLLGQLDYAIASFSLHLEQVLKLSTPQGSEVWHSLGEDGAMLAMAVSGGGGAESMVAFLTMPSSNRDSFVNTVEMQIRGIQPSDATHALYRIVNHPEVRSFVSPHGPIQMEEQRPELTPLLDLLSDTLGPEKRIFGSKEITVVWPEDRIASYMEGILLLGEKPEVEIAKAGNWEAIGYQYRRAGDNGSAILAYEEALQLLRRSSANPNIIEENVQHHIGEIESKLRSLKAREVESESDGEGSVS